jgi:hypothetical protein
MDPRVETASTVQETSTVRRKAGNWLLLRADRKRFTVVTVLAIVLVVATLVSSGVLAVGPDSQVATIFGSGLISGLLTLMTIALSINQLVLSRVFGTPAGLADRLEGARELLRKVEGLADRPSSPNDPAAFLSMIAVTLSGRAADLLTRRESTDWSPPPEVTSALRDLVEYGQNIDEAVDEQTTVATALSAVIGTEYAVNMVAVHHVLNEHAATFPADVQREFQALEELLESIAIVRQFYKTIALQQDFAQLSRLIVYSGFVALLTALTLTLVYRTNSVTLPPSVLPLLVSLGLGVVLTPLVVFVVYILRAATVARQTISVGPFVPPDTR